MHRRSFFVVVAALVLVTTAAAQQRPASPEGTSATQIGRNWIEVTYGRPILRGRTGIFGSGADYGKKVLDGGPVWRAGANNTTMLRNEVALEIGGKRVPPGAHALLIELKSPTEWTLIVSDQAVQRTYNERNTTELWGGYNYTPARDVTRAPMRVEMIPFAVEQLTWGFSDVTATGGTLRIWWDKSMASVPFKVLQ
jgi:hypothetical protein